jgi:hypothetical protein
MKNWRRILPFGRIMPIERLFQVLINETFPLFGPKIWDDPFENLLMDSNFWLDRHFVNVKKIRDSYFGVCWSMTKESDAMWKIYSPDCRGVKIKTTAGKVFDKIFDSLDDEKLLDFIVGEVRYHDEQGIKQEFGSLGSNDFIKDKNGTLIPISLLVKRTGFKHEDEVRFIYQDKSHDGDVVNIKEFDWLDIIEEIEFHTHLDYGVMDSYKSILTEHFELDGAKLKKSKFYDKIKLEVNL